MKTRRPERERERNEEVFGCLIYNQDISIQLITPKIEPISEFSARK